MPPDPPMNLSRRERQIMDVVYRLGRATAADVTAQLADPPTYTTVRGLLRVLEGKGHLRHEQDGPRYVYLPTVPRDAAQASALSHLVRTFFGGSAEAAVAALLDLKGEDISDTELDDLAQLIERARRKES